jgi:hypothetical protein
MKCVQPRDTLGGKVTVLVVEGMMAQGRREEAAPKMDEQLHGLVERSNFDVIPIFIAQRRDCGS